MSMKQLDIKNIKYFGLCNLHQLLDTNSSNLMLDLEMKYNLSGF